MSDNYASDPAIESLVIDDAQRASEWNVYLNDATIEIIAYREPDGSLWFAAKENGVVYKRINGRFVVEVNHVR